MTKALPFLLSITLLSASCGAKEEVPEPRAESAPSPTAGNAAPVAPPGDGGAPVGMVSSRGEVVAGGPAVAAEGGNLDFKLPADWTSQAPSSSMRMAQAAIPGRAGAGELAVFHFGPGEGGVAEAMLVAAFLRQREDRRRAEQAAA